jgi:hypothetical protein
MGAEPPGQAQVSRDWRILCGMSKADAAASTGIGFGSALAITISWSQWHSILWAIIHGVCSWFYVLYFWWTRR